jgi:hypothetical protein
MAYSPTIARLTATLPNFGDANFDGRVDVADLGLLASNWQSSTDWSGGISITTGWSMSQI